MAPRALRKSADLRLGVRSTTTLQQIMQSLMTQVSLSYSVSRTTTATKDRTACTLGGARRCHVCYTVGGSKKTTGARGHCRESLLVLPCHHSAYAPVCEQGIEVHDGVWRRSTERRTARKLLLFQRAKGETLLILVIVLHAGKNTVVESFPPPGYPYCSSTSS